MSLFFSIMVCLTWRNHHILNFASINSTQTSFANIIQSFDCQRLMIRLATLKVHCLYLKTHNVQHFDKPKKHM
jgi:hypothetical protein